MTPDVRSRRPAVAAERGIALVMALMVLLAMSLLSVLLMVSLSVETKISGYSARSAQALNVAEAGVAEALARISNGDVPNNLDPQMVTQIYLAPAGSVPVVVGDSVALPTGQPAGQWLDYSTATKSQDVLTVEYRTDTAKTVIYRYDEDLNPPIQPISGYPIFRIQSTGRKGQQYRRIVADVIQKPIDVNIKAAVAAEIDVKFSGNAVICGYNHRYDTPEGTGEVGRVGAGGCNENPGIFHWETGTGDMPGIWSTDDVQSGGGAQPFGTPAELDGQAGFYAGPWEALGMTQAAFYQLVGPARSVPPAVPNGLIHLDNNGTGQDQSGDFAYDGGDGSGLLYVDGDLTLNGDFSYRGLIYVEGDLKLNGNAWVLGGVVVRGKSELKNVGAATVLYSEDAILLSLSKAAGQFLTISWREMPRPQ